MCIVYNKYSWVTVRSTSLATRPPYLPCRWKRGASPRQSLFWQTQAQPHVAKTLIHQPHIPYTSIQSESPNSCSRQSFPQRRVRPKISTVPHEKKKTEVPRPTTDNHQTYDQNENDDGPGSGHNIFTREGAN